ncbi:serine/arginine-rich splicing factor 10-like isoform X2 [Biomphalaria pfeifferi]|uniref:Serine/arginine-rich splicing factor 10-like isoform X2 n=1 Tax=Biomphalaria pfeifferi TaxID=112525 RepID=A0AAD8BU70_BIOPF|nr:serine/arginine-rich splicing factor 10-like isoform X2 [Biomphalaria pfeifferi]
MRMSRYSRPPNSSLYVRNVPDGTRPEELRAMFGKMPSGFKVKPKARVVQLFITGPIKPTRQSPYKQDQTSSYVVGIIEGMGIVFKINQLTCLNNHTFEDPRDADDALYHLDRTRFYGRELEIEFARGDRKSPGQMRGKERSRRSPYSRYDDYDRRRNRSRSRSPRNRSRSRSPYRSSRRSRTRSRTPKRDRTYSRSRSHSGSYDRKKENGSRSRSKTRSPAKSDKEEEREESPAE